MQTHLDAYAAGVLVSASADKTLKVWDLDTGIEIRTLAGHSDRVNSVAVTPDGRRAIYASADRTPSHGFTGLGGTQRRLPVGGSA